MEHQDFLLPVYFLIETFIYIYLKRQVKCLKDIFKEQ